MKVKCSKKLPLWHIQHVDIEDPVIYEWLARVFIDQGRMQCLINEGQNLNSADLIETCHFFLRSFKPNGAAYLGLHYPPPPPPQFIHKLVWVILNVLVIKVSVITDDDSCAAPALSNCDKYVLLKDTTQCLRTEPATHRSQVEHSTTEPLCSGKPIGYIYVCTSMGIFTLNVSCNCYTPNGTEER